MDQSNDKEPKKKLPILINCRCHITHFTKYMNHLRSKMRQSHIQLLSVTPFYPFLDMPIITQERSTIDNLLGRYDIEKGCFRVGNKELNFTIEDVGRLTGLPVDGRVTDMKTRLGSPLYQKYFTNRDTGRDEIENILDELVEKESFEEELDFGGMVVLYMLGCIFFPNSNLKMPLWAFKYCDKVEDMTRLAWARAVHKFMFDVIPRASQKVQERNRGVDVNVGYLHGCTVILCIWFYEVTGIVQPSSYGLVPPILNWGTKNFRQRTSIAALMACHEETLQEAPSMRRGQDVQGGIYPIDLRSRKRKYSTRRNRELVVHKSGQSNSCKLDDMLVDW